MCLLFTITTSIAQDFQEIQIANEYVSKGEKEKALQAYQHLIKNQQNISLIHSNYFNLLISLGHYKQAEDYLHKLIRRETKYTYKLDLGILLVKEGELAKANKYFDNLFSDDREAFHLKMSADYLASYNLLDYAIQALVTARKIAGPTIYNLELANLYRLNGNRMQMIEVYLDYISQVPANISYTKNMLQMLLTKPEEFDALEEVLYNRIQKDQQSEVYADLLVWVNLQQKNFSGAFIQARSYDKRFRKDQSKTLEIGQIAMNNSDYEVAIKCFTFVVKEFPNTENYLPAQLGIIRAHEAKVKNTFPVNNQAIRLLIKEYKEFKNQNPNNPNAEEAYLSLSMLHSLYLNELDSGVYYLLKLIDSPTASAIQRAQAKINLGDIYLLKGEPWESTLLYSQVEKSQHESTLGYEAKLRNAKLWYFNGEFKLAQEHLDILKQATTREIANDAMDLSMRIKENITFDTTGIALKEFSAIELLVYQNKLDQAIQRLDTFNSTTSPGIQDDVYWLQANLLMKKGRFNEALKKLEKILSEFGDDILADDAYFLQGDIYEHQLKNKDKAMEIYREFLNKFPGSVYAAEARKRYRTLRGDFAELPNQ
ncbi:MAG TPA: hypothetical protein DGG95_08695 [Cytophagales bacterium]|nr:hypothetical protein [Cytophagales bacterium]